MIIHVKSGVEETKVAELSDQLKAVGYKSAEGHHVLITPSKLKELPDFAEAYTESFSVASSDIQLASKDYKPSLRELDINGTKVGGNTHHTMIIGGPCSIESWEQITQSANLLKDLGISTLRAGCYKPRTSPYSFQGLGLEGLKMLAKVREEFGLNIITEVRDASHVDDVIEYADIVQVGAKAMYDHGILRACGKARKPVLIKRGFGTTLQEFAQAAEFVLSGGNEQVMLCERGIRTFETKTRFTLDLCGVAFIKEYTNLPVILDPSHAMGYRYGIADLSRACVAMGVDGLLVETHPTPAKALSDAAQQLDHDEFRALHASLSPIASAIGRSLI